ncbi:uncharacterized protein N7459_002429 [Penicillium hispanicum]|uniref:uncharacterized protein n=1 Tax=Penicillium hispanicum TaxID=1080232 RepID=UPI0025425D1B|nr:uncharacterized protein N7459_002429 [Penicillium hispanicum]KAJ5586664.1 hypothetical protein N7459_002429 [Penicillium hispanicum]
MVASPGTAAKPEKTMSSRLLTMKFMQRAAASAVAKETPTPGSDDDAIHTPKRRRVSTETGSPGTPQSDLDAISAALAAEEEKRREAVARQAAEAGETQWVLDVPTAAEHPPQPLVVAADSLDAEDDVPQGGRRSYGNFKRKQKTTEAVEFADPEQVKSKSEKKKVKLSELTSISGAGGGSRHSMGAPSSAKKKKRKST